MSLNKAARRLKKKVALLKGEVRKARKQYLLQVDIAAALEREKTFSETLIRHMPTAIAFLDQEFRVRIVNPAHLRILGKEKAREVLERPYFEVIPSLERSLKPACEAVFASGCPQVIEDFKITLGEDHTYWDLTQVPVCYESDEVEGVLLLANEVTDRIQRERLQQLQVKQLQEQDRMKEEILSIISHELRTPLNFITGFASLLEDGVAGKLNAHQREYLENILKGADRMTRLIEDLLVMSQLATGKIECLAVPVCLETLLLEIQEIMAGPFSDKGCRLSLDFENRLPSITADPRYLHRLLYNLVDNALKFSPKGGNVTLRASMVGDGLQVEVIDEGDGIPTEQHQRIFERFYQIDMSSTRTNGGIGMGLAIAKSMVEVLGGQIGVESSPGEGSRFWFALPSRLTLKGQAATID